MNEHILPVVQSGNAVDNINPLQEINGEQKKEGGLII